MNRLYDCISNVLNNIMSEYTSLLTFLMNKENTREIFKDLYRDKFEYLIKAYCHLVNDFQNEEDLVDLVKGISKNLYKTNLGWIPKNNETTYKFMTFLSDKENQNRLREKYIGMMEKIYPIQEIKSKYETIK